MKRLPAVLLLLVIMTPAQAQFTPDPDYERVLVPVFFFGGGQGGAKWFTSFDMVAPGNGFRLATPVLRDEQSCAFCPCEVKAEVEEMKAETICGQFEHPFGLLLWVPRSVDKDTVHTSLRVSDRSREGERAGAQIPVVWERDLYADAFVLLDVKTEPRYRSAIRLYDAFQYPSDFVLRFYDMEELRKGTREMLFETIVRAERDTTATGRFPLRPAFLMIGDIVARWPQLASSESVAIEVVGTSLPISPPQYDRRFYALASITNNVTNEVTIVSPR
jgi:hypothetical protein